MTFIKNYLYVIVIITWYVIPNVLCGGVPTEEMILAQSIEEYERLHIIGGISYNETMRTEYLQRRLQEKSKPLLASYFNGIPGFYHGVASGDPLPHAVILWTRYTPILETDVITLELRMSPMISTLPLSDHLNPDRNTDLRRVKIEVSGSSDWVAKLDVTGLPSGTNFIYAFTDGTTTSDIGQTKTAPEFDADVSQLVYAVFSCSNFATGYFHPYDVASTIQDLDFWIHVGDYVVRYESSHILYLYVSL